MKEFDVTKASSGFGLVVKGFRVYLIGAFYLQATPGGENYAVQPVHQPWWRVSGQFRV